jgi:hypothetical protein
MVMIVSAACPVIVSVIVAVIMMVQRAQRLIAALRVVLGIIRRLDRGKLHVPCVFYRDFPADYGFCDSGASVF